MGVLAEASGITTEVFRTADLWLRRLKGGLYQAVIVGSAAFAAISGSTTVNALVFSRIAFPKMVGLGYSKSLSLGAIAGAGSFAAMIPPSITMVIYAIMTEQSVGQLLIAGLIPRGGDGAGLSGRHQRLGANRPEARSRHHREGELGGAVARARPGLAHRDPDTPGDGRHLHRGISAVGGGRGRRVRRVPVRPGPHEAPAGVAGGGPAGRGVHLLHHVHDPGRRPAAFAHAGRHRSHRSPGGGDHQRRRHTHSSS